MSGILQVEEHVVSRHVFQLKSYLNTVTALLGTARSAEDYSILDWAALYDGVTSRFNVVFDDLSLDESGEDVELDIIEGEEQMQIDTTLHPLDPDNEDDEWHEGFDDA